MKRDWIWGWVAALPSIIVAFLAIGSTALFSERPSIAVGLALALATTISTGILWIKNRHSLRKIIQSGGDVELLVRPTDALVSAANLFVIILGAIILLLLFIEGRVLVEWGLALFSAITVSIGMLWIKNRHRLLKVNESGGDLELLRRSIDVFWIAAIVFSTFVLPDLVVEIESGLGIIFIGLAAYLWSLNDTAYKNPNDEDRWRKRQAG